MADEILTVRDVAQLLKVADKTIYTMARNAELPCFKVRGQRRFRRLDLDSWIASQVTSPGAPDQPATRPKASTPNVGTRR